MRTLERDLQDLQELNDKLSVLLNVPKGLEGPDHLRNVVSIIEDMAYAIQQQLIPIGEYAVVIPAEEINAI